MAKERAGLNLTDDLDLSEFSPTQTKRQAEGDIKVIEKIAEQSGFPSRAGKRRRKKSQQSPFKNQLNLKCRDGMKELFQDIGVHLEVHDHTTFEQALLALIEREGDKALLQRYKEIAKPLAEH